MGKVFLGLDTCSFWMNLALLDEEGALLGEVHEKAATHTTGLVPAIESLLGRCARSSRDLAAVGAVTGPGSFTGLRVGLATALGYCAALGIPAFGIGSLEALAAFAPVEGEGIALLDARRKKVYGARFLAKRGEAPRLLSPGADLAPEEVLGGWRPAWAVGDGVPLVADWPEGCALLSEIPNLGLPAARNALKKLKAGKPGETLAARYVRAPDAIRKGSPMSRPLSTGIPSP